jgi:hypothetical protein
MDEVALAHGTRLVFDGERLSEVIDRHGHRLARIAWRDGVLSSAMVWGEPGSAPVVISDAIVAHPVLGDSHALSCGAVMSAIDWARPARIPAIDRPAAIPGGAGTLLLDLIALSAARAGVAALRYDGPYPTHALWGSLATCFRTSGSERDFVAGGAASIDFAPAPFERVHVHARAWVELRDGLERASIDGLRYGICSRGAHRLVRVSDSELAAELWIGDAPLARVAVFDARGELISPPRAPDVYDSPVLGRAFPPPLTAELAELVADAVPAPLADAARAFVSASRLAWADTGCELARARGGSIELHAALWDRLAPHGLARVAQALAEAIEPLARRRAAATLSEQAVQELTQ